MMRSPTGFSYEEAPLGPRVFVSVAALGANADVVDLLESEKRPLPPPVAEIGTDQP